MSDAPTSEAARAAEALSFLQRHQQDFARQARWFLIGRVVVALVCLVVLLVYEEGQPRSFTGAYVVLILALGLTAGQLMLSPRVEDLERYVLIVICMDVVIETVLAYLTGGIYNLGFAFLYFASILAAVFLISDRAGLLTASVATVSLAAIAVVYWAAAHYEAFRPPLVPPELYVGLELRWGRITANLIGVMFAFHGVALLAGRLPYRLSQVRILYDEILERMHEGIVAIDRRGRIVCANAEVRRLLNWGHSGRLVGKRYEHVLRRDEDQAVLDVLARGEDVHAELDLPIRGKGRVAVEARTTVLRDDSGGIRGVVGIFRDMSLRRRLEEMEVRLARLSDTEEMALGIAHEIRNPLGSIRGAVQELAAHAFTDPADRRLAEIVQRESARLDRIIQQFLDFARMRPPTRHRHDLHVLVEETALLLSQRADAAAVAVKCVGEGPFEVEADPDQLRQAFLNIGVNALEALGGAGTLRFALAPVSLPEARPLGGSGRALAARRGVEVTVENSGAPLTADVARRLFTPFYTTKKGGLGLGMAITQKVIRRHEGDVSAEPSQLGGACFRVTLPLADGALSDLVS